MADKTNSENPENSQPTGGSAGESKAKHPQNLLHRHKDYCGCRACKRKTAVLIESNGGQRPEGIEKDDPIPSALLADPLVVNKDGAKDKVVTYVRLKAEGWSKKEIAERMGIKPETLNVYLRKATQEGWLRIEDPLERFQTQLVPRIVDNIEFFLKAKDRTMTIEAAKGAGIFKSHQALKVESDGPQTVLALKIETAPGQETKIAQGVILGTARESE